MLMLSMKRINQYEHILLQIQQMINFATDRMKKVDASGHYESDDETGFFFEQLKNLQNIFDDIFEIEEEENADRKEEKEEEKGQ
tara:strand:- start:48 stop:299 length:252 start_codon:yes stop_codon:yes gene_type:complete